MASGRYRSRFCTDAQLVVEFFKGAVAFRVSESAIAKGLVTNRVHALIISAEKHIAIHSSMC